MLGSLSQRNAREEVMDETLPMGTPEETCWDKLDSTKRLRGKVRYMFENV